jgi:hypothetical protein
MTVSIVLLCHYADCRYAECCVLFIVMMSVILLNVVMLNVVMLSVIILSVLAANTTTERKPEACREYKNLKKIVKDRVRGQN